ncbi:MAG: hypothetical protein AABY53_06865 [Bdellovibrionota bacterium]
MSYLIAIESDPKCYKEIEQGWADVAKELGHEVLLFKTIEEFKTEFAKPEYLNKVILLIIVGHDKFKGDLKTELEAFKTKYKCDLLLSIFDDPIKPVKKTELLPVHNIIYKPFDLTILKEHTRFAVLKGQKLRPLFVHTTQASTTIESLKRFKILQLSEFAFKIDKAHTLEINKSYKFYNSLFANKKNQHAWGRVINSAADYYELVFSQVSPPVLTQIRKKVATSNQKVKAPNWIGLSENKHTALRIALQVSEEAVEKSLQELLSRNFKDLSFVLNKDINPKAKIIADVIITEMAYDTKLIETQFLKKPLIIRIFDKEIPRSELEKSFEIEFLRIEKPLDKALLVKMFKLCYPMMTEGGEEIQRITAQLSDDTMLAEVVNIQDFSEAGITFTDKIRHEVGEIIEIALPQDDEANRQEIKAKVNFASEKPSGDKEKVFSHQFVLFGMKDEYLKMIRLWALQKHIDKKK